MASTIYTLNQAICHTLKTYLAQVQFKEVCAVLQEISL